MGGEARWRMPRRGGARRGRGAGRRCAPPAPSARVPHARFLVLPPDAPHPPRSPPAAPWRAADSVAHSGGGSERGFVVLSRWGEVVHRAGCPCNPCSARRRALGAPPEEPAGKHAVPAPMWRAKDVDNLGEDGLGGARVRLRRAVSDLSPPSNPLPSFTFSFPTRHSPALPCPPPPS